MEHIINENLFSKLILKGIIMDKVWLTLVIAVGFILLISMDRLTSWVIKKFFNGRPNSFME